MLWAPVGVGDFQEATLVIRFKSFSDTLGSPAKPSNTCGGNLRGMPGGSRTLSGEISSRW